MDLSNKKIKKLSKPTPQQAQVTVLILDDNELQRLDNIDSFTKLQKVFFVEFFGVVSITKFAVVGGTKSTPANVWSVSFAFITHIKPGAQRNSNN